MPRDLFARQGTTSDAIYDIFCARLSREEVRRKWEASDYGEPKPSKDHMAGWLKLRGGV